MCKRGFRFYMGKWFDPQGLSTLYVCGCDLVRGNLWNLGLSVKMT